MQRNFTGTCRESRQVGTLRAPLAGKVSTLGLIVGSCNETSPLPVTGQSQDGSIEGVLLDFLNIW